LPEPVAVASVVCTALWALSAFQKAALNTTGHRPVATVVTRSGFLRGRLCALGLLFLGLTYYRRDCLKLFAIA
jgi:hypothetical protein